MNWVSHRPLPHIYTRQEIDRLLRAALTLPPHRGLYHWTYYALLGLLAVTGLRISEALNLKRSDADLRQGILTIRRSKFDKSRLVVLHPSTCARLRHYERVRDACLGQAAPDFFFLSTRGTRLRPQHVQFVFAHLSRQIGLRHPLQARPPRIHDFRHSSGSRIIAPWVHQVAYFPEDRVIA